MNNTVNYNLKKPSEADEVLIGDFNDNSDIIDTELKKLDTEIKSLESNKVTKIGGKGLSSNDFTAGYLNKINNTSTDFYNHKTDQNIHITQDDKYKWNNASNPNLLINGDFKVWQRGKEIQLNTSKWTYTADRWRARGTGKVIKDIKGLKSIGNSTEVQYIMETIDYDTIKNKKVTISYSINGLTYAKPYQMGSNAYNITLQSNEILNWVKAEIGEFATPFIPKSYGEELIACQRYYQKYIASPEQSIKSTTFSNKFVGAFPIPKMRIVPKIIAKDIHSYASYGIIPVNLEAYPYSADNYLNLWFSNISYPDTSDGYLMNKSTDETGGIFLDAEIY